jgi:hypothetical protein
MGIDFMSAAMDANGFEVIVIDISSVASAWDTIINYKLQNYI